LPIIFFFICSNDDQLPFTNGLEAKGVAQTINSEDRDDYLRSDGWTNVDDVAQRGSRGIGSWGFAL